MVGGHELCRCVPVWKQHHEYHSFVKLILIILTIKKKTSKEKADGQGHKKQEAQGNARVMPIFPLTAAVFSMVN